MVHRLSDLWPYHGPCHYDECSLKRRGFTTWLFRTTCYSGEWLPQARVAPSAWLAKQLTPNRCSPVRVIPNAVPIPSQLEVRPPGPTLRLGFIALKPFEPRKGLSSLVAALAKLPQAGPRLELHVFGAAGRSRPPTIPRVQLVMHDRFAPCEIGEVCRRFDVLICPSRHDNSPNVVTEALAHGRPVIAQEGLGMSTYLTPEVGALLDFHGNPVTAAEALAKAIQTILGDYLGYSSRAAAHARAHFAPAVIGARYRELYTELLAAPQGRG